MAGEDARSPYTAGSAPDYYLDAEVARFDGTATVLIQRTRASIVGTPNVAVTSIPTVSVGAVPTSFSVIGIPTVVLANQPTVTVANIATVAIGTYASPATIAIGTQAMPTTFVVPPATVAVGTQAMPTTFVVPPATVAVATLAFPTLTISGTVSAAGGTVTIANQPTVTVANPQATVVPVLPASCIVRVMSYRIMSRSALTQNIFSIWNGSPSLVLDLHKLTLECDYSQISVPTIGGPIFRAFRLASTSPFASGFDITNRKFTNNPNHSSDASVVVRCDATGDNVIASAVITASYLGAGASAPFGMAQPQKLFTIVGLGPTPDQVLVESNGDDRRAPQIWPAQGAIVQMTVPSVGQAPSTFSYTVEAIWREGIK